MLRAGLSSLLAASILVFAQVQPSVQVDPPLTKAGNRLGIRPSTTAVSGSMSAVQASDLAFVLAGGAATPTPSPADPLLFYGGQVASIGNASVIVSDNFTRANVATPPGMAQTGQTWVEQSGSWGIQSNSLYRSSAPADNSVIINSGISDGLVRFTVKTNSSDSFGVLVRGTDATHYVVFNFWTGDGGFRWYRCNGGCTAISGVSSYAGPGGGEVVEVVQNGDSLSGYLNGVLLLSVTESFNDTATKQGVRYSSDGNAQSFDDYSVTSSLTAGIGITLRGNYVNGTDHSTITLGESGSGGTFADTTGAPWTASKYVSTVTTGTAPMVAASTTKVANWNSDLLDGLDSTAFALAGSSYFTMVSTRNVTATSANSSPITLAAAMTPLACTAEVQSVGVGAGTCTYALFDSTASSALCTVSLACNSSSGATGTCASSGSAASGHVLVLQETAPAANTSSAFVVLTCSH